MQVVAIEREEIKLSLLSDDISISCGRKITQD
jgi:hypothetical protein